MSAPNTIAALVALTGLVGEPTSAEPPTSGAHPRAVAARGTRAMAIGRFRRPDGGGDSGSRLAYYLTVGLTLWVAWQLITGAGVLLAGWLPPTVRLEPAAPLTFLLLLAPMLTSRAAVVAAGVGAAVAVAASGLPLGLGLLVGTAACAAAARATSGAGAGHA